MGLHPMSHGLCTLSHVSYAMQPRYCRNYALKIYDTRRNRRNAPSVARFSLTCPPWQVISVLHVHNPTVSKWLRYSLNQMHMRIPWRCRSLQMLMHIYCGGLQIPHGDKPMDFASSSVTSVSLFFKVRQPAR